MFNGNMFLVSGHGVAKAINYSLAPDKIADFVGTLLTSGACCAFC